MKNRRVLVTAGLPYSNGRLHVGHIAGCYLPADIYVRFLRMQGVDVRYVCGSDDHGVAITTTAEKENKTPAEVARFYNLKQQEDFKGLNILFDVYGSTSQSEYHTEISQKFFLAIHEKGFLQKQSTKQFYDESRQQFLPDRYVQGTCAYCQTPNQYGDQCENCGKMLDVQHLIDPVSTLSKKPATVKETVHWFLDLSHFGDKVAEWLKTANIRDTTRNFITGLINTGLVKRAMTRDLQWGIPVPLPDPDAKGKVLYVWFDAPIGYISNSVEMAKNEGLDISKPNPWWHNSDTEIYHFIGEDNTVFHCLIWIAMLAGEGKYNLPTGVIVNHFLNIQFSDSDVEKISKSRGRAVWINEYISEGNDPDVLRYYLTSIAPEKARTVYQPQELIGKNNSDLANVLGNFINRVMTFTHKTCGGLIPTVKPEKITEREVTFEKTKHEAFKKATEQLEQFSPKNALLTIMDFARDCNKYVDEKAPWTAKKTDPEDMNVTLKYCLDSIQFLGVVLAPFMPNAASKIRKMVNSDLTDVKWESALNKLPENHKLNEAQILFTKIEN